MIVYVPVGVKRESLTTEHIYFCSPGGENANGSLDPFVESERETTHLGLETNPLPRL